MTRTLAVMFHTACGLFQLRVCRTVIPYFTCCHCMSLVSCRWCIGGAHNVACFKFPSPVHFRHVAQPILCCVVPCRAMLCCAEGAIDEAMAEVLDEEYPGASMMNGAGGAFVV